MTDAMRTWVMCGLSTLIGSGIVVAMNRRPGSALPSSPRQLTVSLPTVLPPNRFPGMTPLKSPVLVEFMDYECPPCRRQETEVVTFLKNHPEVRRVIRHFPLKMHSQAMPAAILAEKARISGNFLKVHKSLIEKQISQDLLTQISQELTLEKVDKVKASLSVSQDIADGKKLEIQGTPTNILCLKNGDVFQISSISQAEGLLK
jgi:protein-disulfide isomerase